MGGLLTQMGGSMAQSAMSNQQSQNSQAGTAGNAAFGQGYQTPNSQQAYQPPTSTSSFAELYRRYNGG